MTKGVAKFIKEVVVIDPDTKLPVEISIYKDMTTEGIFGIDSSFLTSGDVEEVKSPFNDETLTLEGD
ncbi:MAG: hypothetical protein ACTS9Y_01190 [Methylophilus sp.]|uniref:hypothetical protein n=1 Tax=Methylophilus sp. TaxID=29541 RepID=UPI003F9F0F8C